jgi:hypothetical protein
MQTAAMIGGGNPTRFGRAVTWQAESVISVVGALTLRRDAFQDQSVVRRAVGHSRELA